MAASASDRFQKVGMSTATTLSAPGYTIGNTSITVASTTNWPTDTGVTFAIDEVETVDGQEVRVAGTYNIFRGTVASATSITNLTYVGGDANRNYSAGASTRVYILVSYAQVNRMIDGILVEHNQDGTHGTMTADALTVDGALAVTGTSTLTGALTVKSWDGWISPTDTWTYVSPTSFKITGSDVSSKFPVGTKIKLTQTTVKYFYVTACSFSTDTTVTITGGSDYSLANAAITSPGISYSDTPQGFPQFFNYTPTYTQITPGNGTVIARFSMIGKTVHLYFELVWGSTTSMGTIVDTKVTLPVTGSSNYKQFFQICPAIAFDNSAATIYYIAGVADTDSPTAVRLQQMLASGTYLAAGRVDSAIPMTWATSDKLMISGTYEAA